MSTSRGVWQSLLALTLGVGMITCGGDGTGPPGGNDTTPASVTVSGGAEVNIAGTLELSAQAKNAAGQNVTATFTWSSSDPAVATVDATGKVTGVARGAVTITASTAGASGMVTGSQSVTVRIASVVVQPDAATLTSLGETIMLAAEARDALGNAVPAVALTFTTSDPGIATVANDGTVTAVGNGTATITASGDGRTGQATITVSQVATSLSMPATVDTLTSFGDMQAYTATAADARGNAITTGFTWTATNTAVATVSGSGSTVSAVAVGNGTTTVRVMRDGMMAEATLVVKQEVATVSVTPSDATVLETLTAQLAGSAVDARGNPVSGVVLTWSSDDPSVATVDATGNVTGQAEGITTVMAMGGGQTGSATITVLVPSLAQHVQPIFTASCALSGCHAAPNPAQGMNLSSGETFANTVNVQSNGSALVRIKPLLPDSSYLVYKIEGTQSSVGGSGSRMPLGGAPLSQEQINTIRAWITKGAANN